MSPSTLLKLKNLTLGIGVGCVVWTGFAVLASPLTTAAIAIISTVFLIAIYAYLLRLTQHLLDREVALLAEGGVASARLPIILFLRSFESEEHHLRERIRGIASLLVSFSWSKSIWYDHEEVVSDVVNPCGLFVAIGDRFATFGAAKLKPDDASWQPLFIELAQHARMIFILPGRTPSVIWELSQILRTRTLAKKAIFVMPRRSKAEEWLEASRLLEANFGNKLPSWSPDGMYFRLTDRLEVEAVELEALMRAL